MATKSKRSKAVRRPEHKIGPFHAGLGVAVWLNLAQTAEGPRYFRSLTIAPRRYRDPATGQWKDATSYRPADLTTLIIALQEAQRYVTANPLPGQPMEGDDFEDLQLDDGEILEESSPG
jgi:hypothetical protein